MDETMNAYTHMIPVTQKASNVCASCRVRKQRCDRSLPRCDRCAAKGKDCDYAPYKDPPRVESYELETLVRQYETCLHTDLSPRGTTELLRAVAAHIDTSDSATSLSALTSLVQRMLDLADSDLAAALGEFGPCIQQWCPIISEDLLIGCEHDLSLRMHGQDDSGKRPLLQLCLWLVTCRPCPYHTHMGANELYRALKQVHAILQSTVGMELDALQAGMIMAVYEVGHAMHRQAFQTTANCAATLKVMELGMKRLGTTESSETVEWLKASLVMLDRMIPLSVPMNTLPLTVSSHDSISRSIQHSLSLTIPPSPPRAYASSPRKVHIRSVVSLASGQVLEHIHFREHRLEPDKTYDQVDFTINVCIKMLVDKPQPHTWLHCDAIAMAFCSHILLQHAQMRHLNTTFQHPFTLGAPTSEYLKVNLALKYSRRMAWDMVRVAMQKIQLEAEIPYLPFAGLCAVLRAGLAVIETREFADEDVVEEVELHAFRKILEWFAGRWDMGREYLSRLEELRGFI